MTTDEAIIAHAAARRLRALYDAYRASSRAHALVLRRLAERLQADDPRFEARSRELLERVALSRQTDLAFAIRSEHVRRRLLRLREEYPLP
ncbi:hypothetical protein [Paraliomyxa miuraensis]|uniref:hypothetical protein n=1 Tax=Paraliomyxa miuraensis TaxID=376150 RepID=UPI00225BC412|nr:hypothetical protein [Paraliomyxa miuraensis]MCX4240480.1 hypothetical protein [Paraliomyxa miuraensis]